MRTSSAVLLGLTVLVLAGCSSLPRYSPSEVSAGVTLTEKNDAWVLTPSNRPPTDVGVLFYPGGLVKPEAYLPVLSKIAVHETVILVKMPFDLAFFDSEKGLRVTGLAPSVHRWVVAGHSLGGVAGAMLVAKHPTFAGLILLASYPSDSTDLSGLSLPVLSISASNDGLATPAKLAAADHLLPSTTQRVVVKGGNHGQFANYGEQKGDGMAEISREEQQGQVAAAVLSFLQRLP